MVYICDTRLLHPRIKAPTMASSTRSLQSKKSLCWYGRISAHVAVYQFLLLIVLPAATIAQSRPTLRVYVAANQTANSTESGTYIEEINTGNFTNLENSTNAGNNAADEDNTETGLHTGYYIETDRQYDLHFNYDPSSPMGPQHWNEVDEDARDGWADFDVFDNTDAHDLDIRKNQCDQERRPSPVNLYANQECSDTHEILTRKIRQSMCTFRDMTFEIAPHTLRANMPYDDIDCERPTVDFPNGLPNDWLLTWIEIHLRSEHVINGRRYDGEINFIHVGTGGQNSDLGAPSLLLDASGTADEPLLQRFIDKWQAISDTVRTNCVERRRRRQLGLDESDIERVNHQNSFMSMLDKYRSNLPKRERLYEKSEYVGSDAVERVNHHNKANDHKLRHLEESKSARRKMFPYDMWPGIYFYRYKGSLLYPPCSTIIHWRVFDEPLIISRRQFKQLSFLLSSYLDENTCENKSVASPKGENFGPLREIIHEEQNVTHCTAKDFTYWQYPQHKQ